MQIAVLAEHRLGHGGTQGRVDLTHQHGGLAEGAVEPLLELTAGAVGIVVDPQAVLDGRAVVAAAEKGSVGGCCQRCLYLFLRGDEVVVIDVVLIINLGQTDKELVVVGHQLGGRAGRENE